jgi:chaperone required for assembly of F1-ATPase
MSIRDLLNDVSPDAERDPIEAAQRAMRPQSFRRFYAAATVAEAGGAFSVLLDGKPVRTPARRVLEMPTRALAEAVAAEWQRQGQAIDPARLPLTRLANSIIDTVAPAPERVVAEVKKYLASDLLCYRAEGPQALMTRQAEHWDPIIDWAYAALGARFVLSQGVSFVAQPERSLANAGAAIPADPWRLAAVHVMTTLTGSALLALAVLRGRLDADAAWRSALLDEDWNMQQWGRDELALKGREFRHAEMQAAATVLEAMA